MRAHGKIGKRRDRNEITKLRGKIWLIRDDSFLDSLISDYVELLISKLKSYCALQMSFQYRFSVTSSHLPP